MFVVEGVDGVTHIDQVLFLLQGKTFVMNMTSHYLSYRYQVSCIHQEVYVAEYIVDFPACLSLPSPLTKIKLCEFKEFQFTVSIF